MEYRSDADLLRLARNYDLAALTAIYDRFCQPLYYYALRLLGEPELAEDCVADTFSRFLKTIRNGVGPDNFLKAYLYRSTHNWISDHYKREPQPCLSLGDEMTGSGQDDPVEMAETHITQERIRNALKLLTSDQRQVICLRYLEGWDIDEVAQAINKPIGAVKSLQHRAIAALQKNLNPEVPFHGLVYGLEH